MNSKKNILTRNFLWLSISLSGLFWLVESGIDAYIFHSGTFFQRLTEPDPNEVWMRIFITSIVIGFGRFAQKAYRQEEEAHSQSEDSQRLMLRTAHDAFIQNDAEGLILDWSEQAALTFGWSREEVLGKSLMETIFSHQGREVAKDSLTHFVSLGGSIAENKRVELSAIHRDGHELPIEITTWPSKRGETFLFNAFLRDISERKKAETNKRLAASVFENAAEAIIVTDAKSTILMVNAAFTRITGYPAAEVIGENPNVFQSGKHSEGFYREMWDTISKTGQWKGEIWDRKKNGEIFPKMLSITSVQDANGDIIQYTGLFTDITLKKAYEENLHFRANYDLLTGLANRELFSERLSQSLKAATKNNQKTAILFVDLVNFKQVNDTLGHLIGDEILKMAAERLGSCIRGNDTLARVGGDEFLIVLSNILERQEVVVVSERINEKFLQPFTLDGDSALVGASVGIAIAPTDGDEITALIHHADQAMYQAKAIGGNHFLFFDQLSTSSEKTILPVQNS